MTDSDVVSAVPLANPIMNTSHDVPTRHFEIGLSGPTGNIVESRRPSAAYIPVSPVRRGRQREADTGRDNRILYAQREATETVIFLAEVSDRKTSCNVIRDWRTERGEIDDGHSAELPRVGRGWRRERLLSHV